jgi:hypothetical protein
MRKMHEKHQPLARANRIRRGASPNGKLYARAAVRRWGAGVPCVHVPYSTYP